MISVIVAIARNRAIGFENRLLYRLPDDLRRFKALTTGHTIIMGRKTFESFPKGALPNRRNIVLSKNKAAVFPGAETFSSLQEALSHCKEHKDFPHLSDRLFPMKDNCAISLFYLSEHPLYLKGSHATAPCQKFLRMVHTLLPYHRSC